MSDLNPGSPTGGLPPYGPAGQPGQQGQTAQYNQQDWSQYQQYQQYQQYPPPPSPRPQPPRRNRPGRSIGIALGAVGLAAVVGLGVGHFVWTPQSSPGLVAQSGNRNFGTVPAQPNTPSAPAPSGTSIDVAAIEAKVDPGLVDINTELGYQNAAAAGTGIVLTSNGEILTNNHVVEGATSISVTDIGNGQTYSATVVGYDRSHDIAVLQLANASGLATETLADSSSVAVGDAVVGIGNAGGKGGTPSAAPGAVTALNQSITASDQSSSSSEQLTGLIQVDANIQSGDSGGALVNSDGQVIGVDTAASTGYQFNGGGRGFGGAQGSLGGGQGGTATGNQGYAVPITDAITIAHQIVAKSASNTVHIGESAFLGISVADAGQTQGGGLGGQGGTTAAGAQIQDVVSNGPAATAGLTAGDVITALNGQTVDSATTLTNLMDTQHPGNKISLTVASADGQQRTVTVVPTVGPVG
jgi:S1-C subfamily serine protease